MKVKSTVVTVLFFLSGVGLLPTAANAQTTTVDGVQVEEIGYVVPLNPDGTGYYAVVHTRSSDKAATVCQKVAPQNNAIYLNVDVRDRLLGVPKAYRCKGVAATTA